MVDFLFAIRNSHFVFRISYFVFRISYFKRVSKLTNFLKTSLKPLV